MKAIYESVQPYLQIGYWDVNAVLSAFSDEKTTKRGNIIEPSIVGTVVNLPSNESDRNRFYLFREGENHNQLTLTDPKEILNMREFIKYRDQIVEVYCDGDPVEEIKAQETSEEDLSEEFEEDYEEPVDNSYSEWDEQMVRRLDT